MIKRILNFLDKNASGKNVILLLVVTLAVYGFMLTYTIPNVMRYTGGLKLLDMQPTGYNIEYVRNLFDTLGEPGREAYLYGQIPIDMVYPSLFAITYSLLLAFLFKRAFKQTGNFGYLIFIPVLGGLFDYLENIGIIIMLLIYPDFSRFMAVTTNIFSVLKSLFTTIFFILLLTAIIVILVKRFRRSN